MSVTACDLRIPADHFYWAVLESAALPGSPRSRRRHTQLGYLFESVLPVPIETVCAVYVSLADHRVLACGIERKALKAHAVPGILTLGPVALPGFIEDSFTIDPASLNLLVGAFEPLAIRRSRARVTAMTCAAALCCVLAFGWGQFRRAGHQHTLAANSQDAAGVVYEQILPHSASTLPPAARLTAELRLLDSTRGGRTEAAAPIEIAPTLAAVLASWPTDLHITTESLSASATVITLSARLPDEAAAERFERELRPPAGWRLGQPTVQRERGQIAVRLRMEPEGTP